MNSCSTVCEYVRTFCDIGHESAFDGTVAGIFDRTVGRTEDVGACFNYVGGRWPARGNAKVYAWRAQYLHNRFLFEYRHEI